MTTFRLTKAHREQVRAIERAGFRAEPVRYTRGDHVMLRVSMGDRSASVVIAGSPSDHRATLNLVRCARRACGVA